MRNTFSQEITKLAIENSKIILLTGDIGNKLFDDLQRKTVNQFINCGIAEQNMIGVAAGMGLTGLRPIVYTITPFVTMRCLEQIKIDVAYHKSPVILIGTGSGLSYSNLGPTHHSLDDIAILRVLPDINILAPWDSKSLIKCINLALSNNLPTYIRIGKKGELDLSKEYKIPEMGEGLKITDGKKICILAIGTIASHAVEAAKSLSSIGVNISVILMHTAKPISEDYIKKLCVEYRYIVTVEEHSKIGGFGDAIRDILDKIKFKGKFLKIGAQDKFISNNGTHEYAREIAKIDHLNIYNIINDFYFEEDINCI